MCGSVSTTAFFFDCVRLCGGFTCDGGKGDSDVVCSGSGVRSIAGFWLRVVDDSYSPHHTLQCLSCGSGFPNVACRSDCCQSFLSFGSWPRVDCIKG